MVSSSLVGIVFGLLRRVSWLQVGVVFVFHGESLPRTSLLRMFIISFAANLFLGTVSSYEKYISLYSCVSLQNNNTHP